MSLDVSKWRIADVRRALRSRQASAREICASALARIAEQNPANNAFLTLTEERAMARAVAVDTQMALGEEMPPLAGVPLAVKDVIQIAGVRNTCSSRIQTAQ
jgi:aspartyl-tRNA(Asn)/glutamyl-tRNA(Gln) amidotransferase subunit A